MIIYLFKYNLKFNINTIHNNTLNFLFKIKISK